MRTAIQQRAEQYVHAHLKSIFQDMLFPSNRGANFSWERVPVWGSRIAIQTYFVAVHDDVSEREELRKHLQEYCESITPEMVKAYRELEEINNPIPI